MKRVVKKIGYIMLIMLVLGITFKMEQIEALTAPIPDSFQSGQPVKAPKYIGGYQYFFVYAADGSPIYCLESWKNPPRGVTYNKASQLDNGILAILQNGYPNKGFTGDGNQDYFITKTAIWWYLDRINGTDDNTDGWLKAPFKTTASDSYNLRPHIKALMELGLAHRSDATQSHGISLSVSSQKMSLTEDKKYFQSELVAVQSSAILNEYTVALTSGTKNTKIVDNNGTEKTKFAGNETFRIIVPASEVKDLKAEFSVKVTASTGVSVVYRYETADPNVQAIVPGIDIEWKDASAPLKFQLTTTRVEISKQDVTTKKEVAGAKLVLRDANNNIIDEWTSTAEPHYIDYLPAGKYSLEETVAPKGYVLNKQKVEFELTEDGQVKTVVMYNEPIVEVPDTAVNSSIFVYIIGAGLLVFGAGTIYRHGKKHN